MHEYKFIFFDGKNSHMYTLTSVRKMTEKAVLTTRQKFEFFLTDQGITIVNEVVKTPDWVRTISYENGSTRTIKGSDPGFKNVLEVIQKG